jgi:iron(III) transport system substrate-binding protein
MHPMYKPVRKLVVTIGLGLVVFAAVGRGNLEAAEPKTFAEIATYTGADRQAVLEAGARKEGQIVFYSVGGQIKPVLDLFQQKYPYVHLQPLEGQTIDLTRRIIEEHKAKHYAVDAFELDDGALALLRDEKILQPFNTPEMAAFAPTGVEEHKLWVSAYESYKGLGFNTKLVPPDQAPKSFDDLLDPKWKGKMAVAASPLPTSIGGMIAIKGEEYVRKLGKQDVPVYQMNARALANLVISGEVAMSPVIYNSHVFESAKTGAPIAWSALDGVYAIVSGVASTTNPPHPYSAMLFLDYMLSKDGQGVRVNMGYISARTDLVSPGKPARIIYPSQIPDLAEKFEKWTALGQEVFGKARPAPPEPKK